MVSLRAFLKWAKKQQYSVIDPTEIDLVRQKGRMVTYLSDDEMRALLSIPDQGTLQ